jgi:hypothetical protein
MLERTHPDPVLREAVLEELQRRTKFKDVIFRALGVQERSVDQEGDCPLWIVTLDKAMQHPWHEALLTPGGDCPIGFVVNTYLDNVTLANPQLRESRIAWAEAPSSLWEDPEFSETVRRNLPWNRVTS